MEGDGEGCVVAWDWMLVTPKNIDGAKGELYKKLKPFFVEEVRVCEEERKTGVGARSEARRTRALGNTTYNFACRCRCRFVVAKPF